MGAETPLYSNEKIKEILPHRYPFLLVDKVLSVTDGPETSSREGRSVKAIKCVTVNEPFFQGHFPQQAVMPGVLLVEVIAQAGALAYFRPNDSAGEIMIASINSAKFRRPVVPGDQLEIHASVEKDRRNMTVIDGKIFVDGQKVAEANIMAYVTLSNR
ncbi:MAG: 3-hydroxyacyl-ACP dehydratase FabZ [Bdellovibrionales bacterium]|nr:3-hydroxyacyl-ACP dehydratase FabZ [Bdellovibrionales bacterium]